MVRKKLDRAELESFPKTTGGDGMHIFVPLEPRYTYEQVRSLAEVLARMVAHERPDLFTTPRAVAKREKGKVYFDWMQIGEGKTDFGSVRGSRVCGRSGSDAAGMARGHAEALRRSSSIWVTRWHGSIAWEICSKAC